MIAIASLNLCNLGSDALPWRLQHFARLITDTLAAPAILALQEIKSTGPALADGRVPGDAAYGALSAAIVAAGGPRYAYCEVAPIDGADGGQAGFNIRVGLLFDPQRVSLVERAPGGPLDATGVRRAAGSVQLTRSPGRIMPTDPAFAGCSERHWLPSRKALVTEFQIGDSTLFIVNCHLKSMRSPDRRAEDYAKKQRHAQATAIHTFCASLLALDPQARLLIAGDMNDLCGSKTLDLLRGTQLVNLIDSLPRHERYTHRHGQRPQALDHVLVSPALQALARVHIPHVHSNATPPLASDHDPVLIELDLPAHG